MDYYSLKRRELQALCKKHNIPANSANSVLADELSALLNEPKPKTRQKTCMKSSVETTDEAEPAELKRQAKKVRFRPNNDLVEYELRPGEKQKEIVTQMRGRRKSVAKKVDKPIGDDNNTVELVDESARIPVKVTRSRVQLSVKDVVIPNNEKKKGRRGAKDVEKGTDVDKETEEHVGKVTRSRAHTLQKGDGVQHEINKQGKRVVKEVKEETKTVDETVVAHVRVTRSKAQNLMEGGTGSNANAKKKSGKQEKTEEQNVEPSKEVMDVPVRATRSRRQTVKEDIENTVTNNTQADKKRTRREMKATDSSSNSSHVAPVDKQEPPKRKSLRTRGVEPVDEDEGDQMEVVNKSRVTRSKAPLATEASGRNTRNKTSKVEIEQHDEPLKPVGKKNVNRRKSVLQPEKTEVDPHLEESVNHPARKNTRQKSVVQKATETIESPTAGEKQSKGLSGDIDKENVTRSGKDASANNFEEVTAVTPTSRKRRGTPIIEDPIIEKSPKSSTCSPGKSEGKSVAKKQVESSLKKPMSKGKNSAIRSGAIIRDGSSKKRVKVSATKQSDSEDNAVNSSKEWTPVAKMRNLKREEVNEPEVTPAIVKSGRRFTRSTIKEQPTAETQNVAKFKHDPAVNTAPGRITRRGIKPDGNAAGSYSEKVGKKQTRQSAHKKPLDDAQMASPEVVEVGPTSDVGTTGVQSEIKQPLDEVQMGSPEITEVGPTLDVGTMGVQSEIKQPLHEVQISSPGFAEVGVNPDVDTIGAQFEIKQPLDEVQMSSPEITEVGVTPDVDTIGAQSEIKPSLDEVQMSSPEVAEVGPDQGVDTIGVQSEIKQPYDDDVQMCSPQVAEVQLNPDSDTIEVGSEVSKEVTGQTLGDLSPSESARLPTKVVEKNIVSVEVMEDAGACNEKSTHEASARQCLTESLLSGKQQNPLESQSFDAGTPLEKNVSHIKMTPFSMADVAETVPVQNQNEVSVESGIFNEAVNLETSVVKSGRPDATEKEMESTELGSTLKGMQTDLMIEEPLVSVSQTVVVEEGVDNKRDPSLRISSVDEHDVADDGEQYDEDESASAQKPLISEPDSEDRGVADEVDVQENLVSGNEIYGECDNAISDRKSHFDMFGTPLIGKGDVQDDDINALKELETGSELSDVNKSIDIYIEGVNKSDVQDGESEHDQLASNDIHATNEEDVGGDDLEPAQNESMPVADEVLVRSDHEPEQLMNVVVDDDPRDLAGQSDSVTSEDVPEDDTVVKVDALEESVVDIKKDVVSIILGDTYDMDAEGDGGNEDEGFRPNESRGISSDLSNEQTKEEAETIIGNDDALDDQEQAAAIYDDSDNCKFMEDGLHIGVNEVDSELVGNIEPHVDPTKEEASPILYTKGEHTVDGIDSSQLMGDIGAHESLITKESSPITYKNEESPVDDADSDSPTIKEDDRNKQDEIRSAGTSVDWGDYDLGMDEFEKPVSANGSADMEGKGKQDDQDSDLQSSGLAAGLTNSVRKLEKDSRNGLDGKSNQEVDMLKESANAADMTEVFNWPDSSLKSLFTTSATSTRRHINNSKADNEDIGSSRTAAHEFNHQWDNKSKDFDGETTHGNAVRGSESEIHGVPSFEDYPLKLFEDEEVGGSIDRSESNTHYEFKQFEFLNEATGTSQHNLSGLKDNSTRGFEKKEDDTQMKGSKVDEDLAFDTGRA